MLTNAFLSTEKAALYTSNGTNAIVSAYFCNLSGDPAKFNLYAVPVEGAAGDSNTIYKAINITPADTFVMDVEKIILEDGESIWAEADTADAIAVTIVTVGV